MLLLLRQGLPAIGVNALALVVSAAASLALAGWVGLAGAAGGSVLAIVVDRLISLRRISHHVGVPVRKLQDWRGLAMAFGYALASATLIRLMVDLAVPDGAFHRLALGACGLALAYVPIIHRWRKS